MMTPRTLPHSRADCATARSFFYSSVPEVRRPLSTSQSTFRRSQIEYPTTPDPGRAVPLGPSLGCRDLASHPGAAVLENPVPEFHHHRQTQPRKALRPKETLQRNALIFSFF